MDVTTAATKTADNFVDACAAGTFVDASGRTHAIPPEIFTDSSGYVHSCASCSMPCPHPKCPTQKIPAMIAATRRERSWGDYARDEFNRQARRAGSAAAGYAVDRAGEWFKGRVEAGARRAKEMADIASGKTTYHQLANGEEKLSAVAGAGLDGALQGTPWHFGRKVHFTDADKCHATRTYVSEWCNSAQNGELAPSRIFFTNVNTPATSSNWWQNQNGMQLPISWKWDYQGGLVFKYGNPDSNVFITNLTPSLGAVDPDQVPERGFVDLWNDESRFDTIFNFMRCDGIEIETKWLEPAYTQEITNEGVEDSIVTKPINAGDPGIVRIIPWSGDQSWLVQAPAAVFPGMVVEPTHINTTYLDQLPREQFSPAELPITQRREAIHSVGLRPAQPRVSPVPVNGTTAALVYGPLPEVNMYEYAADQANLNGWGAILVWDTQSYLVNAGDPTHVQPPVLPTDTFAYSFAIRFKVKVTWHTLLPSYQFLLPMGDPSADNRLVVTPFPARIDWAAFCSTYLDVLQREQADIVARTEAALAAAAGSGLFPVDVPSPPKKRKLADDTDGYVDLASLTLSPPSSPQ